MTSKKKKKKVQQCNSASDLMFFIKISDKLKVSCTFT